MSLHAQRYDCGNGESLTIREIARRTGNSVGATHARIHKYGWRGTELLRPKRAKRYDCGGEQLTIAEISARTGVSEQTIRSRLARGWRGKELLVDSQSRRRNGMPRGPVQVIACKLALAFDYGELPTTAQIRKIHPMSHASAMRWRNALRQAIAET